MQVMVALQSAGGAYTESEKAAGGDLGIPLVFRHVGHVAPAVYAVSVDDGTPGLYEGQELLKKLASLRTTAEEKNEAFEITKFGC